MWKLGIILALFSLSYAADWSYSGANGPDHWKDQYDICGQKQQSPINIVIADTEYDADLGEFTFTEYDSTDNYTMRVRNNGHTAQVDLLGTDKEWPTISAGGLGATYRAAQFHFHWGSDDTKGSEHTINGAAYPLEMHIVHFNDKYASLSDAAAQSDGLAVLGLFYKVGAVENAGLKTVTDNLQHVLHKDDTQSITKFPLNSLFGSMDKTRFYRYPGSLTTPGCFESVQWTGFAQAQDISTGQLEAFRSLKTGNSSSGIMVDNFRPPLPLNYRKVKQNMFSWSYMGPTGASYWKDMTGNNCGLTKQSPINIVPERTSYQELGNFVTTHYDRAPDGMKIKNNGHTAQVDIENSTQTIHGANLHGTFEAAQFHFHWGQSNTEGSEHRVNGDMYPLELHIVHYNTKYADIGAAISQSDGLAVLGIFFEIQENDNTAYNKILDHIDQVQYKDNTASIPPFPLNDLLAQLDMSKFYRYNGSLTTPPCHESVTWTVFADQIGISVNQLSKLRGMYEFKVNEANRNIYYNYRPPLPRNEREVLRSWTDPVPTCGPAAAAPAAAQVYNKLAALFLMFVIYLLP